VTRGFGAGTGALYLGVLPSRLIDIAQQSVVTMF
jgi:hypothetical protein